MLTFLLEALTAGYHEKHWVSVSVGQTSLPCWGCQRTATFSARTKDLGLNLDLWSYTLVGTPWACSSHPWRLVGSSGMLSRDKFWVGMIYFLSFFVCLFWDKVSVVPVVLDFCGSPPASASWLLKLQVWITMPFHSDEMLYSRPDLIVLDFVTFRIQKVT
jgi:hypothetical protein